LKKLELEVLESKEEITEGFLICKNCKITYPIISKIAILWNDFSFYLSCRSSLGGQLYSDSISAEMRKFVKKSLLSVSKNIEDRALVERRWVSIYSISNRSRFYSTIKNSLKKIPRAKIALEHGSSIGIVAEFLAKKHDLVFGIDSSYPAISFSKKTFIKNADYFVADSLHSPFGKQKFGVIVALNLLELVEPVELLKVISCQIKKGTLIISDPYDFERGKNSVKQVLDAHSIRKSLEKFGFKITKDTSVPRFISWNLKIGERTTLNYKVDLIIGNKV